MNPMMKRVHVIPIVNMSRRITAKARVLIPGALGTVTLTTKDTNIVNHISTDSRGSSSITHERINSFTLHRPTFLEPEI